MMVRPMMGMRIGGDYDMMGAGKERVWKMASGKHKRRMSIGYRRLRDHWHKRMLDLEKVEQVLDHQIERHHLKSSCWPFVRSGQGKLDLEQRDSRLNAIGIRPSAH
jgi:hypothetical protein